jgi:hypothetical protein
MTLEEGISLVKSDATSSENKKAHFINGKLEKDKKQIDVNKYLMQVIEFCFLF